MPLDTINRAQLKELRRQRDNNALQDLNTPMLPLPLKHLPILNRIRSFVIFATEKRVLQVNDWSC
eukprot:m.134753 g.134753  ORF g.134753 m.134753 type:complete len:65 (+) comp15978_c0_seq3:3093-3287(+)